MILGIDASNIRRGGGVTHLVELLRAAHPQEYGFSQVYVWSNRDTLSKIVERPWLLKVPVPALEKNLLRRAFWQCFTLSRLARRQGCAVLLVPGGSYLGTFQPAVTLSQNMLPFEWRELKRFGFSLLTCKLVLLRVVQSCTFRRVQGLIFLTRYAQNVVMQLLKKTQAHTHVIPFGVDQRFFLAPRAQLPITQYAPKKPFRILYVSIIDMYKHQWNVAEAVAKLRGQGFPIAIDFVGPAYPAALKRLQTTLHKLDPQGEFLHYCGAEPYTELHQRYAKAQLCLFASSCENLPNILLEGMASGLPIACSKCGPMPEVLGEAGEYFDPEDIQSIVVALERLIASPELRTTYARLSFERAKGYSWLQCAEESFHFFATVAQQTQHS